MSTAPADVQKTVTDFLTSIEKLPEGFGTDTPLYADGAELDSLETAELSATLEDDHGRDPYSIGGIPQTRGEIIAFHAGA